MLHRFTPLFAAVFLVISSTAPAVAGQVTIQGPHLCCGACQTRAEEALPGVPWKREMISEG